MAQGGDSKREKLETPPEILVWSPSEEEEPSLPKEDHTTTSPDSEEALLVTARRSEKASMHTSTDLDETEGTHRHRLLGFLLIPGLVLSSVLVGLDWEGEEIGCDASGDSMAPGMIFPGLLRYESPCEPPESPGGPRPSPPPPVGWVGSVFNLKSIKNQLKIN